MKASPTISLRSSWNISTSSFFHPKPANNRAPGSFQEDLRIHQSMVHGTFFINAISKQQIGFDHSEFSSRSQCAPACATSPSCCFSATSWWEKSLEVLLSIFSMGCRWVKVADLETKKAQPNWVREIWWFIQTQRERNERDLLPHLAVKQ